MPVQFLVVQAITHILEEAELVENPQKRVSNLQSILGLSAR